MTALLERAKSDYLLQAGLDSLHQETIEWLSDLEFCKLELTFLARLMDKTFLRVKGAQRINELTALEKKVKSFRMKTRRELRDAVVRHEEHLAALDEDLFSHDEQKIREEHKKHALGVKAFMGTVKKIKKEIFDFVEREIKTVRK